MRSVLFVLLAVVAGAAAVLSFDALRGLAIDSGFSPALGWLLPVVVDAGAAAGTLAWIKREAAGRAQAFGRVLALVLYTLSVGGNAVSHGLSAYGLRPPWWLVVVVSGVAPAVLGAVVHLAVLVGQAGVSGRVSEVSAPSGEVAASARTRAIEAAEKHRTEHGELPSIRALMPLADVGKGTAADALSTLRNGVSDDLSEDVRA